MKSPRLRRAFPYTRILPPLTGAETVEADREPLTEGVLGVQAPVVSEGAEVTPTFVELPWLE